MRKFFLYLLVIGGFIFILILMYGVKRYHVIDYLFSKREANIIEINSSTPVLAVFSFRSEEQNQILKSFHHYTIKLNKVCHLKLDRSEIAQISDTLPLMITVETLGKYVFPSRRNNPVNDVVKGRYDRVIKELCTQLIGTRPNVYLRFNPEMEVPGNSYLWQRFGPVYIDAFRHFSALCKTYAPQVKQVWGPAGYPGAMEYYPGDDLVDAASITLKSDSEMLLTKYPTDYPVAYDLFRRLHRLRFIAKPIFVLGSKQIVNDSINEQLVSSITQKFNQERSIAYSEANFKRPETKYEFNPDRKIEIGLYDPQSLLNEEKPLTVEHLFVDFGNLYDGTFQESFNKAVERGHNVIVTFEPFRIPNGETDLQVLQHVTEGKYDPEINHLYSIILSTARRVYLRYAHEMEIPTDRYPWQSQDPVTYIKSFRYFMTFKDSLPATIKRIWGPAGDRGSTEWWPGNDVVDFVSIAIYGLPDKNITDPNKQESFSVIFNRKYWRLRFIDKPIFITEFGVKGPEEYKTNWLEGAAKVIRENPQIVGINYFNMSDTPKAWGDIEPPDWSISRKSFYHFLEELKKE
jgi:beta-mannanase